MATLTLGGVNCLLVGFAFNFKGSTRDFHSNTVAFVFEANCGNCCAPRSELFIMHAKFVDSKTFIPSTRTSFSFRGINEIILRLICTICSAFLFSGTVWNLETFPCMYFVL